MKIAFYIEETDKLELWSQEELSINKGYVRRLGLVFKELFEKGKTQEVPSRVFVAWNDKWKCVSMLDDSAPSNHILNRINELTGSFANGRI